MVFCQAFFISMRHFWDESKILIGCHGSRLLRRLHHRPPLKSACTRSDLLVYRVIMLNWSTGFTPSGLTCCHVVVPGKTTLHSIVQDLTALKIHRDHLQTNHSLFTSVIHSRVELHHHGPSDDLLQKVTWGLLAYTHFSLNEK